MVIYTTLNAQSVQTATDVAKKVLPNLKVNAVTGGSIPLLKRMESEAAAFPAALHDPQNLWVSANTRVVVAMLNTKRLDGAAPRTWADLADPKYKGKIIIADPGDSSTAFTALWGMEQVLGAEGLKKFAANTTVSSAASNVVRAVGQGEYAVGITARKPSDRSPRCSISRPSKMPWTRPTTAFGLASYFHSPDVGRIFRVSEALEYGMVDYVALKFPCPGDILK